MPSPRHPQPFYTGFLPEQDGHQVYFAQYGNVAGPAIVSLHGGPGSQSKLKHINGFDLNQYHLIQFDQRGCGQSQPNGELSHNTTQDLVDDMERLRQQLKLDSWYLTGGSWGSTLALAYAEAHPNRVSGLMLSSIFLARAEDLAWSFTKPGGVEQLFPDLWVERQKFFDQWQTSPATAAAEILKLMETSSPEKVAQLAAGVMNWEGNLMNAFADLSLTNPEDVADEDIAVVKIFLHYEANHFFLKQNQLLKNADQIAHLPTVIVHGRYDVLCPIAQAWALHQQLPQSELIILPTSNHRLTAEGNLAKQLAFKLFLTQQ